MVDSISGVFSANSITPAYQCDDSISLIASLFISVFDDFLKEGITI
jgi:hypothetical protein